MAARDWGLKLVDPKRGEAGRDGPGKGQRSLCKRHANVKAWSESLECSISHYFRL